MDKILHNQSHDRKKRQRYEIFLILSLFFHAAIFLTANRFAIWREHDALLRQDQLKEIEIAIAPDAKKEETKKQQIAETDLIEKSEVAKDDAYLGEQTQTVQKQTKSKDVAAFRTGKGKGAVDNPQVPQQSAPDVKISNLGVKTDFKPLGHLNPADREAAIAGAATNDHLKDVANGAQTLLNTREYAYFSFYRRVRRQLEQFWEPGLKERIRRMTSRGRSLAAEKEHATKLLVVLNDTGQITKVQVEDTSGVVDLDQAAIDAFNRAGPFPNPPHGMIDKDGTVKIEWEFVLRT